MNQTKISTSTYFGILFLVLIFAAIFTRSYIFDIIVQTTGANSLEDSQKATDEVTKFLLSLNQIKFDTSVLNSTYLETLTPFPNFPMDAETLNNFGKANPFIGSFASVAPVVSTTTVTGGLIYSSQRAPLNQGRAVTTVKTRNRR